MATLTISGAGFATITLSVTTGSTGTPMPGDYEVRKERAIVEHEPIGTEYSIGQDMGSDSVRISLSGILVQADLTKFKALADLPQFAAAKGPATLALSGDSSIQSWSYAGCVLKMFLFKPYAGSPVFYKYSADFTQFNGQS